MSTNQRVRLLLRCISISCLAALWACLSACSQVPPSSERDLERGPLSEDDTDEWLQAVFERARKVSAIDEEFKKAHPYKDANTYAYVQQLKSEGFSCHMERPAGRHNAHDSRIQCMRESPQLEFCKSLSVWINSDWPDTKLQAPELEKQRARNVIVDAEFYCFEKSTSVEIKKRIADDLANGTLEVIE